MMGFPPPIIIIIYSNDVVQCDVTFIEIKVCLKMHLDHVVASVKYFYWHWTRTRSPDSLGLGILPL